MAGADIAALQAAANQVLSIIAPGVSRWVRAGVEVSESAPTAATDGVRILLPTAFCGKNVLRSPRLALGLLAHECGHFLHPLEEMAEVERREGVPHWLANILLDVHGEAAIEGIFPALAGPLQHLRRVVKDAHGADYVRQVAAAKTFPERAAAALLAARFAVPAAPFSQVPFGDEQVERLVSMVAGAAGIPAEKLPELARLIVQTFPELREERPPTVPEGTDEVAAGPRIGGRSLGAVQAEAAETVRQGKAHGGGPGRIVEIHFRRERPQPEAERIARTLRARFERPRGFLEVAAPGRLDRLEAARGAPVPFRLDLPHPAGQTPGPQVFLAVDTSGSMRSDGKLRRARLAAQAIALAVEAAGGDVRALLFNGDAVRAPNFAPDPLFASLRHWQSGGTSFLFLPEVWRTFPAHRVILVTDGLGEVPAATEADRRRTAAVVIPPGNPGPLAPVAARAVMLYAVEDLPWVLGMLIPRIQVA